MNIPLKLRLPYEATYIPYRHRNRHGGNVWSEGPVAIRTVSGEEAPVSHRIVGNNEVLKAEVRLFEGSYWWQLNYLGRPVSPAEFKSLAEDGTHLALAALACPFRGHAVLPEEEFFASKPRVLNTTREEQWIKAHRGASRVTFCDSVVIVEAGPPIYYGLRSSWSKLETNVVAGPSELDRIDTGDWRSEPGDSGLYGPSIHARQRAAWEGLAFGPHEFDRERHLLDSQGNSSRMLCRIEELLPAPEAGPQTCARALAERLWRGMRKDGDWDTWPWIRKHVACLASADGIGEYPQDLPHRRVLEDFTAVNWTSFTSSFVKEAEDAREILRRLYSIEGLDDQDDAAIGRLGL